MIARREFSSAFVIVMLVAVAAFGGGINFVLSQEYLNSAQASNLWGVETIMFLGYDATDSDTLLYHDGYLSNSQPYWHGNRSPDGINHGERISVYVQNSSEKKVTFSKISLANIVYSFQDMGPNYKMTPYSLDAPLNNKEYTIVINGNLNSPADTIVGNIPELNPGQKATIILELDQSIKQDRDMHLEITTEKDNVFVYTIISGQRIT
jgi:hypothetical protein